MLALSTVYLRWQPTRQIKQVVTSAFIVVSCNIVSVAPCDISHVSPAAFDVARLCYPVGQSIKASLALGTVKLYPCSFKQDTLFSLPCQEKSLFNFLRHCGAIRCQLLPYVRSLRACVGLVNYFFSLFKKLLRPTLHLVKSVSRSQK